MIKKPAVKVIPVKNAPKLINMQPQSGIRDAVAAEAWGLKQGYSVVYFMASREKVYAERCVCADGAGSNPMCKANHLKVAA